MKYLQKCHHARVQTTIKKDATPLWKIKSFFRKVKIIDSLWKLNSSTVDRYMMLELPTTWSLLILGDKRAYSSDGTTDKAETSIPCKIMQGY